MQDRIKLLRNELNLSVTKFAESLNISKSLISLYESGQRNISNRTLLDICRIYNVNEEWLRTGKGEMFNPLDREQEVAVIAKRILKADYDDVFSKWVKNLATLDNEELATLDKIIKKLVKEEKDSSK